jgi:hypothetical protein
MALGLCSSEQGRRFREPLLRGDEPIEQNLGSRKKGTLASREWFRPLAYFAVKK